jgi:hypothetical protein
VSTFAPVALLGVASILFSPAVSLGQSIVHASGDYQSQQWPAPVRNVQYTETQSWPGDSSAMQAGPLNPLRSPLPPHHVIQSPTKPKKTTRHSSQAPVPRHPSFAHHHRMLQPTPALLPEAKQRETWKTPYSYGYFGASGTRHWTKHHGYRDRHTEWRLR